MNSRRLRIEYRRVDSLRPDSNNARIHSDKQVEQIAESIKSFGFIVPFVVDNNLQVILGHGRLLACKLLGKKSVPVIRVSDLSDYQRLALMIADNQLTVNSEWDDRLLGEQLRILSEAEIDFNIEVTGFEIGEIDLFIENLNPPAEGEEDPADVLPEPSATRVSRLGDIWQLGKHRLLCGDALDEGSYLKLMDVIADAILDCTSRKDIVPDPFLGSGTTVIAAERSGRICYGMELDPFTWIPSSADGRSSRTSKQSITTLARHLRHVRRRLGMSDDHDREYKVGFGKPPKQGQFRKGISGNPKGRPKGKRNLATVLERVLEEKIIINENGVRKTITKFEAALKQLVNQAASGDLGAMRQLVALAGSAEEQTVSAPTKQLTDEDRKIMEGVLKRFEGSNKGGDDENH